jgi:hypothetical protein
VLVLPIRSDDDLTRGKEFEHTSTIDPTGSILTTPCCHHTLMKKKATIVLKIFRQGIHHCRRNYRDLMNSTSKRLYPSSRGCRFVAFFSTIGLARSSRVMVFRGRTISIFARVIDDQSQREMLPESLEAWLFACSVHVG